MKKDRIINPRPTWKQIETKRLNDLRLEEESLAKKRKTIKFFQRVGLVAGLIGAAYALNFGGVMPTSEAKTKKGQTSEEVKGDEVNFDEVWVQVKTSVKDTIKEVTPVVKKTGNEVITSAKESASQIGHVSQVLIDDINVPNLDQILPAVPNQQTEHQAIAEVVKTVTPSVTRKLSETEIKSANVTFLEKFGLKIPQTAETKPEPVELQKNITRTPLAEVDKKSEAPKLTDAAFSTISYPYEFEAVNQVMRESGLNIYDIFYPQSAKLNKFENIISYQEVLPIFTDGVMEHSNLVVEEVAKYNNEHPDLQLNPNIFLALMQIETNGANAVSSMQAKGVLQVTTPVAEIYGYKGEDMFKPRINIRVGINYFAEGYKRGITKGLDKMEALKYASMYYNGGPRNANNYFGFTDDPTSPQFKDRMDIVNQEGVKNYLKKYVGNSRMEGYEYWTYGPRMTKVETIKYAESFQRLLIEQFQAIELKKKGLSDSQVREQLKTPKLLLQLKKYIKYRQPEFTDYFAEKNTALNIITSLTMGTGTGVESEVRTTDVGDSDNTTAFDFIRF